MRVDQVDIARDSTVPRNGSQRLPVTEFRHNGDMSRPPDLPHFDTIGARIKWWRKKRGIERSDLAKRIGQKPSTLADLESGRSKDSQRIDLIAMHLGLNPVYLRTDKGDPEGAPQPMVADGPSEWPLLTRLRDLDEIEQGYFEIQAQQLLQNIENARHRKHKKRG
jgi:transcriptional regulator with XRE-family HTH domain